MPGVMSDFVNINEESLARKIGLPVEKVIGQLKKLEEWHFLSYAQRDGKPQVFFLSEFVDTKHFNLSKENYHDRKKDAEERVKAVIDFVNNDEQCRSVLLLRYFGQKDVKPCGQCDVCLRKNRTKPVEYLTIEDQILLVVGDEGVSLDELMHQCTDLDTNCLLDIIRHLIDNGVLTMEPGSHFLKANKKSRHN